MMKLCLGTVQFGMDYGVQGAHKPLRETIEQIIDKAIENEIYHFDTAPVYGDAEELLGKYFWKKGCQKQKIISKLTADAFAKQPKEKWRDIVLQNIEKSLKCLNVAMLESYLFHSAAYIFDPDAVKALYSTVKEGFAMRVGVSVYLPQEAMKALEYDEIGVIQIPYNVFDHRLDQCGFFEKAGQKDIKVYARSSLVQGLALMEPETLPEHMKFASGYIKKFRAVCDSYGISPLQAAVSYVGNHRGIDYVVFGVDSREQLEEYIMMRDKPISGEALRKLNLEFETVEERLINPTLWEQKGKRI